MKIKDLNCPAGRFLPTHLVTGLLTLLLFCLILSGCKVQSENMSDLILSPEETYEKSDSTEFQVVDAANLYDTDDTKDISVVYLAVAPGAAIFMAVLGFHLLSDGLNDILITRRSEQ